MKVNELAVVDLKNVSSESIPDTCGWYDWFCKDSSLKNRSKPFISLVKRLDSKWNNVNLFLKNNCPLPGPLYDSIVFESSDEETIVYCVDKREGKWIVTDVTKHEKIFTSTSVVSVADFMNTLTPPI